MSLRIAVAQISSESNHFVPGLAGLDFFRTTGYLLEGPELLDLGRSDTEVGGFLSILQSEEQVEVVPLIAARANSGNPLSAGCYRSLKGRLIEGLRRKQPVQGVLLSCHGSMGVQGLDDPEGDLAAALRKIVGPQVPVALTLDLHGNLTGAMVHSADILVGYRTYPHRDTLETGQRAARLLLRAAWGLSRPAMALARLPLILTSFNASTEGDGPFARLRRQADRMEQTRPEVLSASVFNLGAYIDVPEMGCSSLVITEGDEALAGELARRLALRHWGDRKAYRVETLTVADAVERGRRVQGGPILLLDTADTTGGGAAGDSIALVRSLIELRVGEPCLAMVVDPQTVRDCWHREPGCRFQVEVGHRLDSAVGEAPGGRGRAAAEIGGPLPLPGRHPGGRRSLHGTLGGLADRQPSIIGHEPSHLRLGRRAVPVAGPGPPPGQVCLRQEHDELPRGLRRHHESLLGGGRSRTHTRRYVHVALPANSQAGLPPGRHARNHRA